MTQLKIDSWNGVQLARLRDFFENVAKPGDEVIFDRKLAESNGRPTEGLDENNCNDWVYRVANQALVGLLEEKIKDLAKTITLTTAYLHSQYPDMIRDQPKITEAAPEPETDLDLLEDEAEEDWNAVLDRYGVKPEATPAAPAAKTKPEPSDQEQDDWAKTLAAYHTREPA